MKKIITALVITVMCMIFGCVCASAYTGVFIDGIPVSFNDSTGYPFIWEGRTLVPLRATMESFGATVDWEADTQTSIVKSGTTTVRCIIGENCVYRNNVRIANDAAAVISNGRTYLPIRAVLEAFGASVGWDGNVIVTSPGDASLINSIETTPSVTTNYWSVWNSAIAMKSSGDYYGAINKIMSISKIFIDTNANSSRAMLFKHLGECYSNLKEYNKASACFKREAYYWSNDPGMEQSEIDANRRSNLIKTATQLYIKSYDKSFGGRKDFGVRHEPAGGIYLGAYVEGDTNIYNPYDPSRFYMDTYPALIGQDIESYLLYLPFGDSVNIYATHIQHAIEKNKLLQISLEPRQGLWQVDRSESYLIGLAQEMENSGARMMLRFAGEMNDTTSRWYSADPNEFITRFRIVSDIFHTYAPSVPVIWAPNFYPPDSIDDYYPGDAYVDYVGISSYMFHSPITDPLGQGVDRSRWSNQLDNIYSLYGHKKPIIVVEGGASYRDYDTWADITPFASRQIQDFYTYLPIKYPNVKMAFLYDTDRPNDRNLFSLSNNYTYLAAYQAGIRSSDLYVMSGNSQYTYDYYELGNNVAVKAESTELASYVTTPTNDVSYVIYSLNGAELGTAYGAPYKVPVDLTSYKGQTVAINVKAFDSAQSPVTDYTVWVYVA